MLHPSKAEKRLLVVTILAIGMTTAITIWIITSTITSRAEEAKRNHDASVCVLSLIHDITPAKGETEDQRRARYESFFADQNLIAKCGLAEDDIRRVKGPPS